MTIIYLQYLYTCCTSIFPIFYFLCQNFHYSFHLSYYYFKVITLNSAASTCLFNYSTVYIFWGNFFSCLTFPMHILYRVIYTWIDNLTRKMAPFIPMGAPQDDNLGPPSCFCYIKMFFQRAQIFYWYCCLTIM